MTEKMFYFIKQSSFLKRVSKFSSKVPAAKYLKKYFGMYLVTVFVSYTVFD
jgi:hypothetical protein